MNRLQRLLIIAALIAPAVPSARADVGINAPPSVIAGQTFTLSVNASNVAAVNWELGEFSLVDPETAGDSSIAVRAGLMVGGDHPKTIRVSAIVYFGSTGGQMPPPPQGTFVDIIAHNNKPTAMASPATQTVRPGGVASLSCSGSDPDPAPQKVHYFWNINQANISSEIDVTAANISFTVGSHGLPIQMADSFEAACTVHDGYGGFKTSDPVTINVEPYPLQKSTPRSDPQLAAGSYVSGSEFNFPVNTVSLINREPVLTNATFITGVNAAVSPAWTAATDPDNDALDCAIAMPPHHGTAAISNGSTGASLYTPADGFSGFDGYAVRCIDPQGGSGIAVVNGQVGNPAGSAPVITPAAYQISNGATLPVPLSATGQGTVIVSGTGINGLVQTQEDETIFTPFLGFTGTGHVIAFATDSQGNRSVADIKITVNPPAIKTIDVYDGAVSNNVKVGSAQNGYGASNIKIDTTLMADGDHTLNVVAIDMVNATSATSLQVIVDNTAPAIQWVRPSTPNENDFVNKNITLSVGASDASGIQLVRLVNPQDNQTHIDLTAVGATGVWEKSYDTRALTDAQYTVEAFAADKAGNESERLKLKVRVDNSGPQLTISYLPAAVTQQNGNITEHLIQGNRDITVQGSDNSGAGMATVQLKFDGVVLKSGAGGTLSYPQFNSSGKTDGVHTMTAIGTDVLGNTTQLDQVVRIDNTSPQLSIISPAAGATVAGGLSQVEVSASDLNNLASLIIEVDGIAVPATLAGNIFTLTTPVAAPGLHQVRVIATDKVGNQTTRVISVTVPNNNGGGNGEDDEENTPPQLNGISLGNGDSVSGGLSVSVSASDNGSIASVTVSVNNGPAVPAVLDSHSGNYLFPLDTTQLPTGNNTVVVTVTDNTGQSTSSSIQVTVDNTDPVIDTLNIADNSTVSGKVSILADANDSQSLEQLQIWIDNQLVASKNVSGNTRQTVGYDWDTKGASNGDHTVEIRAIDKAGNVTSQISHVTVANVAAQAPAEIVISDPKDGDLVHGIEPLRIVTAGDVTSVTFSVDNGAPVQANQTGANEYTINWDTTHNLSDGYHDLHIHAHNGSGVTTKTVRVFVDNTPPTLSLQKPIAGQTLFLVQNLIGTATDSSGLPLEFVRFSLNVSPSQLAFFPGNTDLANHSYAFALDTESLDANGQPKYIDDQDYVLTMTAQDKAGNQASSSVPFKIDNRNVPVSNAAVTWTPVEPFVAGAAKTKVSATVSNAAINSASVTDNSLKVFISKDGETNKQLTGTVQLSGNTLHFLGTIPSNCKVMAVLSVLDGAGNVIRNSHNFVSAMERTAGGVVTLQPDGVLVLHLPGNALPEDALVEIVKVNPSAPILAGAQEAFDQSEEQQTVYGPVYIGATTKSGAEILKLSAEAQIRVQRPLSQISPSQRSGFVDQVQVLRKVSDSQYRWAPLGTSASPFVNVNADSPQARTISVPVESLGTTNRVISFAAPGPGISDLFVAPNPFTPSEGGTDFYYMLGDDSEMDISIYDLLGGLVEHVTIPRGDVGGKMGPNSIHWDGRNGSGDTVGNGGYIVQILAKDSSGKVTRVRTKAAVIK